MENPNYENENIKKKYLKKMRKKCSFTIRKRLYRIERQRIKKTISKN